MVCKILIFFKSPQYTRKESYYSNATEQLQQKHNGKNEQYTQITPHKSHNGHCTPIYRHRTNVDGTSNQPIYFLCRLFVCINSMLFIPKAKPES